MRTINSRFSLLLPVAAAIFALFFGLAAAILPFQIPLAFIFAVGFCVLTWLSPWTAFPIYVVAAMLSPDYKISDLLTILAMAIVTLSSVTRQHSNFAVPKKILIPLAIFFGIIGIQLLIGKFYLGNSWPFVYRDGRVFLYWFWIPVLYVAYSKYSQQNQQKLLRSILVIAIAIATLALAQALTGWQLSGVGRVRDLGVEDSSLAGFTRVQMPGFLFVMFAAVWVSVSLRYQTISLWIAVPLLALFASALIVNYGRGLWFWTASAFLLSIVFVGQRKMIGYFGLLLGALTVSLAVISIAKPNLLESIMSRIVSVQFEGGRGTSYGWRELENRDGLIALKSSPLIGVGIGGEYRDWIKQLRNFEEHTRYVHNSYIFLALKLGIPGLFVLLFLLWKCWWLAYLTKKFADPRTRATLVAWLATFPAVLGLSITQPELMNSPGVTFFALLITWVLLSSNTTDNLDRTEKRHVVRKVINSVNVD